ncbi:Eukaryotic translation initiation factor 2D [Frankliniella fusca]|uniref:Eukaryotic translation initiation factor 2D n=1 Tax=Frankliniella fusca TaxID=407009 RepID=A0AAE1I3F6_9NEOP|nr:Eukaryotic translation initiation factor 2D [Frankliniella fusca]
MEAKRPASDRVDEPAAKRRLSFPLRYKDLVMDLGEEGSLDLTPALDLHPQVLAASPNSNQAEPKTPIPRGVHVVMDISDDQWRGADSPDSETGLEPEDAEAGEAGLSQQEDYRLVLDIDDEEEDSITIPDADEDNATESAASSTVPDKSASKKKKSQMTDFFSRCGTNANGESSTNPPAGELQVGHNKNTRNNNKKRVHENQREKPSGSKQPAQEPASNLCSKLDISEADMKIIAGEAVVWQYYTRVFEDGKKLAKCNECGVVRSIPSGTTTTLTFHLKKHFKWYGLAINLEKAKGNMIDYKP